MPERPVAEPRPGPLEAGAGIRAGAKSQFKVSRFKVSFKVSVFDQCLFGEGGGVRGNNNDVSQNYVSILATITLQSFYNHL